MKENHDESYKTIDHPTLFHELLYSELSEEEKSVKRMVQEAQVIVSAAILTSSWAAAIASFHIINTPEIFKKLRAELVEAIPDPLTLLEWQHLEHLPYLTGCIKEGIRLAYGISSRMPRLARQDLKYKDWLIPAGTPVSMTIVDMNHDEEVFPKSHEFIPERWLNNPTTKDGQPLEPIFCWIWQRFKAMHWVKVRILVASPNTLRVTSTHRITVSLKRSCTWVLLQSSGGFLSNYMRPMCLIPF